jgi:exosortase/archaeosortase
MQFAGILIGVIAFALIGVLHTIVVKVEYHIGAQVWPVFIVAGGITIAGSLAVSDVLTSCILGVAGFSVAYTAYELIKQRERVRRGWYPKKPGKK